MRERAGKRAREGKRERKRDRERERARDKESERASERESERERYIKRERARQTVRTLRPDVWGAFVESPPLATRESPSADMAGCGGDSGKRNASERSRAW